MTRTEELELIARKHRGILRPEDVVAYAQNPKTALHEAFEWDDTEAAHQYRLEQARRVIRAVVTVLPRNGNNVETRAYVALDSDRGSNSYREVSAVLSKREWRDELLAQARRDMVSFKAKYAALSELAGVFKAMDDAAA